MVTGLVVCLLVAGCAKAPPKLVGKVSGVVKINGAPLPKAEVTFIPMTPGLDGNYMATAITDENGVYELAFPDGKPGGVVGENLVTVSEGPMPEEFRGQDGDSQEAAGKYLESLANRPIPDSYGLSSQTSLKVNVVEGQESYPLELSR